jgi:predicted RNase H-like HicB family nuclease
MSQTIAALLSRFRFPPEQRLQLSIQFCVEPDGDGFHAFSPALKGLHVDGATEQEAVENFAAEVPAYILSLQKHGEALPVCHVEVVSEADVPVGAFMRHVQVAWPSLQTSGIS